MTPALNRKAMSAAKEKFATQVTPEILAELRALAQAEGRQLQALVDEALADLIEKRKKSKARTHVLMAYGTSHEAYAALYRNLAK
jgi:Flp pilus assembly protein TadB